MRIKKLKICFMALSLLVLFIGGWVSNSNNLNLMSYNIYAKNYNLDVENSSKDYKNDLMQKAIVKQGKDIKANKQVIIKYKDKPVSKGRNNTKKLNKIKDKKVEVITVDDNRDTHEFMKELEEDSAIEYVQIDYQLYSMNINENNPKGDRFSSDDEVNPNKMALDLMSVEAAWDITRGSEEVIIGILDSDIDYNHPYLKDKIYINTNEIPNNGIDDDKNGYVDDINGWDFVNNDNSVFDLNEQDSHGTHMAGTVLAIAPNVKILPLKFMNGDVGHTSDAIEAIEYAKSLGVKIINCSWGSTNFNYALKEAMNESEALFIASAGNEGLDSAITPVYPAAFDLENIISVGAVTSSGIMASFSNYGTDVHIAAPGVNILSTMPNNTYSQLTGTSVSASYVSGIAGLLHSKSTDSTNKEIAVRIKKNIKNIPTLEGLVASNGIVDTDMALKDNSQIEDYSYLVFNNDPSHNDQDKNNVVQAYSFDPKLLEQLHYGIDGVNPAIGNFSRSYTDLSMVVAGETFSIGRSYNSRDNIWGQFRSGWSINLACYIIEDYYSALIYMPNGKREVFFKYGNTFSSDYSRSTLVKGDDGKFIYTTQDNTTYQFNDNKQVEMITKANGNALYYEYDGGRLIKITHESGDYFQINYSGSIISSISDSSGRAVTYEYDNQLLLRKVIDSLGQITTYEYDNEDLLSEVKNHEGIRVEYINYIHQEGKITDGYVYKHINHLGNTFYYSYDKYLRETTVSDINQKKTKYYYDGSNYIVKIEDPEGKIVIADYYGDGYSSAIENIKYNYISSFNVGTYNDKIVLLGGNDDTGGIGTFHDNFILYDPVTNIWETKPDMQYERSSIHSVELNGELYAISGYNPILPYNNLGHGLVLDIVEKYTPETNSWKTVRRMLTPRFNMGVAAYNDKIYTFGGHKYSGDALKNVEVYDSNIDVWRKKSDMPIAMENSTAITYNDKIYLFGGKHNNSIVKSIYQYNPQNDTWSIVNELPFSGYYQPKVYKNGNVVYVIWKDNTGTFSNVGEYNLDSNEWEILPTTSLLPYPDVMVNGKIYRVDSIKSNRYDNVIIDEYEIYANAKGELKSFTDRDGNRYEFLRDKNGNVTKEINPDGSYREFEYDNKNNLITEKDELGIPTYYIYDDAQVNLIKKVQPINGVDEYVDGVTDKDKYIITSYVYYTESERVQAGYKIKSLLKSITNPMDNSVACSYDAKGNLIEVIDAAGNRVKNQYNDVGLKSSTTSPNGNVTQYSYNDYNQITKALIYSPDTPNTISNNRIVYDTYGRQKLKVSPNLYDDSLDNSGEYTGTLGKEYNYNSSTGTLQSILDEEGNQTSFSGYNVYGNPTYEHKPNGIRYKYEYDIMNRVHKIYIRDLNNVEYLLTEYNYITLSDGIQEKIEKKYINETEFITTVIKYDYANRIIEQINNDGSTIKTVYNANGTVKSKIDANNNTTYYAYDDLNRLIEEKVPFESIGGIVYYSIKKYEYDKNGNIVKELVSSNKPGEVEVYYKKFYEYNSLNKLIMITMYDGNTPVNYTQYHYDAEGNIIRMYTGLSKPLTINGLDDVIANGDNEFSVTKYTYNYLGKLSTLTDPMGMTETYGYDLNGNLVSKIDKNGDSITYTYNNVDLELSRNVVSTNAEKNLTYTFTYDEMGNRKSATGNGSTISYTYDLLGRLSSEQEDNVVKEYTYNLIGNRNKYTLKLDGIAKVQATYTYDDMLRLHQVFENQEVQATYSYDINGNRESLLYNNGNKIEYTYNLSNIIKQITNKRNNDILSQYNYNYYLNGSMDSKEDSLNGITTYHYDGLGRLTHEILPADKSINYTYDDYSNRNSMTVLNSGTSVITTYEYDKNNRMISQDNTDSGITIYTYDNNGNQIKKGEDIFTYDGLNRLLNIQQSNNTIQYTYNVDGLRKSKRINDDVIKHIWDGQNVSLDLSDTNDIISKYIRGVNLITSTNNIKDRFYLFNGHGDVVQLTDKDGNITKQYAYDAFGNEIDIDPNDTNVFRYSGEYFDNETESIYLRARYYNPSTGRFISEDSIKGSLSDPLSLNLYTYAHNNPVMYIDPSGHSATMVWEWAQYNLPDVANKVQNTYYAYAPQIHQAGEWVVNHGVQVWESGKKVLRTAGETIKEGADSFADWVKEKVGGGSSSGGGQDPNKWKNALRNLIDNGQDITNDIIEINKKYSNGNQMNNSISSIVNSASYYENKYDQIASITRSITQHAFENGNKRTAIDTMNMLLKDFNLNSPLTNSQKWNLVYDIAEGVIKDVSEISSILQGY